MEHPENTLAAFSAAISIGITHIETDVHASKDGISVISHDDNLERVASRPGRVSDFTLEELQAIDLGGGNSFPSLEEALFAFPLAYFNIDIKSSDAAAPTVAAIIAARAQHRVLVTSFSESRRRRVSRDLPGVATSASALTFVAALVLAKLRAAPLLAAVLRNVDALQIPESALGLRASDRATIERFRAAGVEVHFWTINDEDSMLRLLDAGADGLVTDRSDLAAVVIEHRR